MTPRKAEGVGTTAPAGGQIHRHKRRKTEEHHCSKLTKEASGWTSFIEVLSAAAKLLPEATHLTRSAV